MRIKAKDPTLISLIGEFLKVYLPSVRGRDGDTIDSYRHSLNLYLQFLRSVQGITLTNVRSGDFARGISRHSWHGCVMTGATPPLPLTTGCQTFGDSAVIL